MNKKYYKKKGPSYKERLRCPLCGKISPIGNFSQEHLFGVYQWRYGGKGDIQVTLVAKPVNFMLLLKDSLKDRFLKLLEKFTGTRYYSQYELDDIIEQYEKKLAENTLQVYPGIKSSIAIKPDLPISIIPKKVVV